MLDIRTRVADAGHYTIDLCGDLDLRTGPALLAHVSRIARDHPREIVLDLHEVRFCDAAGISTLIRSQRVAAEVGCCLTVTRARGLTETVLRITETATPLGLPDAPVRESHRRRAIA